MGASKRFARRGRRDNVVARLVRPNVVARLVRPTACRVGIAVALVCACLAVGDSPSASAAAELTPPPNAPAGSATTFQLDDLHDGHSADQLTTPLHQIWSHDFGAQVEYPLVVNGRVFVVAGPPAGVSGGDGLYSLNATTGAVIWGPVPLGGSYNFNEIAADGGNIYDIDFDGLLQAFSQASGQEVWSAKLPGQYAFTSPPTVRSGIVYVSGAGSGGTVYAVKARTGAVLWTASVENGDHSSPAVAKDGVYVSYACEVSYRFNPTTGANIWTHTTGCEGGGGRTPVVHGSNLYVRDDAGMTPAVLATSTGSQVRSFESTMAPAFEQNLGFFTPGGGYGGGYTLTAENLTTGKVVWSQAGGGQMITPPIVIGSDVAIGSADGSVALYDEHTGALQWSANAGAPIVFPDEHNVVNLVGLVESDQTLYVPASHQLVAFASAI